MPSARVAILMGSDSDRPTVEAASKALAELGVASESRVLSAHRSPRLLREYVAAAPSRGISVFIAAAGGAAHLAGVVASETTLPVIGIPIPSSPLSGLDSLLATVQMPAGVPVATVGIGESGARNAGILAAEILAVSDPALRARLAAAKAAMETKIAGLQPKENA
ncbi:MAG: 5-(carboxyamino)imidazole ribonucleotide mutase [Planctomycetota bacterium]